MPWCVCVCVRACVRGCAWVRVCAWVLVCVQCRALAVACELVCAWMRLNRFLWQRSVDWLLRVRVGSALPAGPALPCQCKV